MLTAYINKETLEPHEITDENHALLKEAVWIDLLSPTKMEETLVEKSLNISLPTREKMSEIETSSRLYKEHDVLFMTASMIIHSHSPNPTLEPISFVLTQHQLITISSNPFSFKLFIAHLPNVDTSHRTAIALLIGLFDTCIEHLADTLELFSSLMDEYSQEVFRPEEDVLTKRDYRQFVRQIGSNGELNTKTRESLITFNRLVTFFQQTADSRFDNEEQLQLIAIEKDISSLSDHAHFLSTKVNFLLDATLGMVNIDQNNIIKIFSVAAVIFLPPTLVASIYGMNFWYIPELSWKYGYLFSIGLIALAAWLPYKYFKHKKWL
jgi:magnesium transporter